MDFFIEGVESVATEATDTARKIIALRERDRARVTNELGRRAGPGTKLLNFLFRQPVIRVKTITPVVDLSNPAANSLVAEFEEMGLLREMTGNKRNRIFEYSEYLSLFSERDQRE